ncbi:MAG: hypothetical protein KGI08_09715 [Thaumarchaeota archaeon]|nr:hypothetical protein [Nitrososphaerota archaeon]
MPDDKDLGKTTWISSYRYPETLQHMPDKMIFCKTCPGIIIFNAAEITERKNRPTNTSTPCKYCSYHPSWPPEPWMDYDGNLEKQA